MDLQTKLAVLADAAKYDASCSSSGTTKRNSSGGKGIGSTEGSGICHSYAPDGRCISLLKILFTNFCTYDCLYCVNRVSSNVQRARFTVEEVVQLTLDFYRRNCIEGLFLSSGIIQSPDYTMERVIEVARVLREEHDFRGYIHLKTIPEASPELLARAGRYADRLSINIELPTSEGLAELAPEKDGAAIRRSMARLRIHIDDAKEARRPQPVTSQIMLPPKRAKAPRFAPAGQSTQMIVGADAATDSAILATSATLYADWLMRFYGFAHEEIVAGPEGMLSLEFDPKLAWALAHLEQFPVDLNRAPKEMLLRVPGLGMKAVGRMLQARRVRRLRAADLERLHVPLAKVLPFVELVDHRPGNALSAADLRQRLARRPRVEAPLQGSLFGEDIAPASAAFAR